MMLGSSRRLIFYEFAEISETILAEGKYLMENEIDPSHLRGAYDDIGGEGDTLDGEGGGGGGGIMNKNKKDKTEKEQLLRFRDCFLPREKEVSKEFFAEQMQKARDSQHINFAMWMLIYAAKAISILVIRDKIIPNFIVSVVLRTVFFFFFGVFLLKLRAILDSWTSLRIKTIIYSIYAVQYAIFYTETLLMDLSASNTFASNLQSVE